MTKQNFIALVKQNLQGFCWPAWFPYPSSWLRTLILIPVALPGTYLIVLGLTGIIISIVDNRPLLLSFSILFGLLLPTVVLAFFYHFIWYIWQQRKSKTKLPKLLPGCSSIWQGLYTTFVLALSFIIILAFFSELAFLDCRYSQLNESLNICTGRLTERAIQLIFISIQNNSFFLKPWFIIWTFTVSYLYQTELLCRKFLINRLRAISKKQIPLKNQDAVNLTEPNSQDTRNTTPINNQQQTQRQTITKRQPYSQKFKSKKLIKVLVNLLLISGGGIYLFTKLPEIKNNLTLYLSAPKISRRIQTHTFKNTVKQAISTTTLIQSANSQQQWQKVVLQWQAVTSTIETSPSSNPQAKPKIPAHQPKSSN